MLKRSGIEKQFLADGLLDEEKLERARAEADRTSTSLLDVIPVLGYATAECGLPVFGEILRPEVCDAVQDGYS